MIPLLRFLGWAGVCLLAAAIVLGAAEEVRLAAPLAHLSLGLVATLAVLFHQSMFLFYYMGITTSLHREVRRRRLPSALLEPLARRGSQMALGALALLSAIAAFTLGGGAHTGALSPRVHGLAALAALATQAAAATAQGRALRRVADAIGEVEGRVG